MAKDTVDVKQKEDPFTFKDPKEYEHLSDAEKKELTKKMKARHEGWMGGQISQMGKKRG